MKIKNKQYAIPAVFVISLLLIGIVGSVSVSAAGLGVNSNTNANVGLKGGNGNTGFGIGAEFGAQAKDRQRIRDPSEVSDEMKSQGQFGAEGEDNFSVNARLQNIQAHEGLVASGFASVEHGTGWAVSNDGNGTLLSVLFVQRTFVNATDNTSGEVNFGNGVLNLAGVSSLNLNLTSSSGNNFNYEVMDKGEVVGKLSVTQGVSVNGFATWSGDLTLDSGESYKLTFATLDNKVRANANAQENANANANLGLWGRIRSFFGFRGGQ